VIVAYLKYRVFWLPPFAWRNERTCENRQSEWPISVRNPEFSEYEKGVPISETSRSYVQTLKETKRSFENQGQDLDGKWPDSEHTVSASSFVILRFSVDKLTSPPLIRSWCSMFDSTRSWPTQTFQTTCTTTLKFFRTPVCTSLTHSWSWALLEKPPIMQLLKNFPAFYGTRRFITVFTRALHYSLSLVRSTNPYHPILCL
jgi:hypothetical protein